MIRNSLAAVAALTISLSGVAMAQDFPNRTLTIVAPFPPGSGVDPVARTLAPVLERELGQSVIVENKTGASGVVGVTSVMNSEPDGHTMLIAMWQQFTQVPQTRNTSYTVDNFIPVYTVAKTPVMFVGRSDLPFDDIPGLVEYAKANPGKLKIGTSGPQSASDIDGNLLAKLAGLDVVFVPYAGAGAAVVGQLGGEVDVNIAIPIAVHQHVEAGTLKYLGTQAPERFQYLPETGTLRESGFDIVDQWTGVILVPKDTPPETVARLEGAISKAVKDESFQAFLKKGLMASFERGGSDSLAEMNAEFEYWKKNLSSIGMTK